MNDRVSDKDGAPLALFLVVAPGLEAVLAEEAREKGFRVTGTIPGGVSLEGGWPEVWRANLVLLDASPLDSLETLRRPRAVIVGGKVLDRTALDAMEAELIATGQ